MAELRVKNRQDLTLNFWRQNVDKILELNDKKILLGKGKITNAQMEEYVRKIYKEFDTRRKKYEAELADNEDLKALESIERKLKKKG